MVSQERQIALTRLAAANPTITLAVFETRGAICVSPIITHLGAFEVHWDAKHGVQSAVVFIAVPLIKVFGFVLTHKLFICLECCCHTGREQGSKYQESWYLLFNPFLWQEGADAQRSWSSSPGTLHPLVSMQTYQEGNIIWLAIIYRASKIIRNQDKQEWCLQRIK